ncbi:MAG: hypothetical protein EAZ24_02050 [Burkholderiales bacterium]|nr:MAG: hypothetical protein EAZ21_05555 [Betaproteobacteria bacterium]TAG84072.1 MAG: hypothetical protein EAZ24_02050 [Burkholderiales bacterium]
MSKSMSSAVTASLCALSLSTVTYRAAADPIGASIAGSIKLSHALGEMAAIGAEVSLYAGAALVVGSVKLVSGVMHVTLQTVRGVTVATLKIGESVGKGLAITAGATVNVVAHTAGFLLMQGDTLLAFAPSAQSQYLLHSSRSS